jgi:hypothetical protein
MNKYFKNLPWLFIILLALIQLVRPILSILEIIDDHHALRQLAATVIIAIIWVGLTVWKRPKDPVKVLVAAGIVYALLGTLMAVALQTFFEWNTEDSVSIPLLLTMGLFGNLMVNIVWGAALGLVAKGIIRFRDRTSIRPDKKR